MALLGDRVALGYFWRRFASGNPLFGLFLNLRCNVMTQGFISRYGPALKIISIPFRHQ